MVFIQLEEKEHWNLEEGKSYFVERNGSSMIAFHLPKKDFQGFHIVASHSDSPTYRIKEQPEMSVEKHYTKLNIERYGGMIPETWFDRPLSVAGRIIIEENGQIKDQLVNIDRDLMIIPNLAFICQDLQMIKTVKSTKRSPAIMWRKSYKRWF